MRPVTFTVKKTPETPVRQSTLAFLFNLSASCFTSCSILYCSEASSDISHGSSAVSSDVVSTEKNASIFFAKGFFGPVIIAKKQATFFYKAAVADVVNIKPQRVSEVLFLMMASQKTPLSITMNDRFAHSADVIPHLGRQRHTYAALPELKQPFHSDNIEACNKELQRIINVIRDHGNTTHYKKIYHALAEKLHGAFEIFCVDKNHKASFELYKKCDLALGITLTSLKKSPLVLQHYFLDIRNETLHVLVLIIRTTLVAPAYRSRALAAGKISLAEKVMQTEPPFEIPGTESIGIHTNTR